MLICLPSKTGYISFMCRSGKKIYVMVESENILKYSKIIYFYIFCVIASSNKNVINFLPPFLHPGSL